MEGQGGSVHGPREPGFRAWSPGNPAVMNLPAMGHVSISLAVFVVNLVSTWFMTGLIWFVQIVHYPLFPHVDRPSWAGYHRRHMRRTGWVVLPAMLIELAAALANCVWVPGELWRGWFISGALILAGIWGSTFLVQVPLHNRLQTSADRKAQQRLVGTNRWRTLGWSIRSLLLAVLTYQLLIPV